MHVVLEGETCGGDKVIKVVDEPRVDPAKLKEFHRQQQEIWDMYATEAAERAAGA